jgi:hypothetical protein
MSKSRRGALRVVVEELVEVAHPVEQQLVRMLRLGAEVLLHHRRVTGGRIAGGMDGPWSPADYKVPMSGASFVASRARLRHNSAGIADPMTPLKLVPAQLTLADLRLIWSAPSGLRSIRGQARGRCRQAGPSIASSRPADGLGVNTGFGLLARTRIDDARSAELQRALVLSHSAVRVRCSTTRSSESSSRSRPPRSRAATPASVGR